MPERHLQAAHELATELHNKGRRDFWRNIVEALIAVVIFAAVISLWVNIRGQNSARTQRTLAACQQANRDRSDLRAAFADSVGILRGGNNPKLEQFINNYTAHVDARLRFRDCSSEGIQTYYAHPPAGVTCRPAGDGFCKP